MGDNRLGGKARQLIRNISYLSALHILTMPDMGTALRLSRRQFWAQRSGRDVEQQARIGNRPVDGDEERLKRAIDASDSLMEDALRLDPRLARRAQWLRRDEGEYCCAGLLAEGDDQPFFKHTRAVVNDATRAGEPLRVVISTDDRRVPDGTAAAFIATARLVQQFMPLEIWWQGAWLNEDRSRGFVFLVPLVRGDMDFARLEFCIADECRDLFSFHVMASHAVLDIGECWDGCGGRAERSYLEDAKGEMLPARFVSHQGIEPSSESIARNAARWLGWHSYLLEELNREQMAQSAAQALPNPAAYRKPTPEDLRRSEILARECSDRQRQESENRLRHFNP